MSTVRVLIVGVVMVAGAVTAHSLGWPSPTSALPPGTIDTLIVDTTTLGNGPNSIATIETCRSTTVGSVFTIDVLADEIPPVDPNSGGINGIAFDLVYNPSVLQITGRDAGGSILFYQNPPLGLYYDVLSDGLPDTDGDYRHEAVELGGPVNESGEGILVRLTVQVVGLGISPLDLNELIFFDGMPGVLDSYSEYYNITNVIDGEIRSDGSSCDLDSDGLQNPIDNCPSHPNPGQEDQYGDGIGDACADLDNDGVDVAVDNCPTVWNQSQADQNADDIGDVCDSVGGEVLIASGVAGGASAWPTLGGIVAVLIATVFGARLYCRLRPS